MLWGLPLRGRMAKAGRRAGRRADGPERAPGGATPNAGRRRHGRRSARGGADCLGADSAARAGGRAGAPTIIEKVLTSNK